MMMIIPVLLVVFLLFVLSYKEDPDEPETRRRSQPYGKVTTASGQTYHHRLDGRYANDNGDVVMWIVLYLMLTAEDQAIYIEPEGYVEGMTEEEAREATSDDVPVHAPEVESYTDAVETEMESARTREFEDDDFIPAQFSFGADDGPKKFDHSDSSSRGSDSSSGNSDHSGSSNSGSNSSYKSSRGSSNSPSEDSQFGSSFGGSDHSGSSGSGSGYSSGAGFGGGGDY